MPRYSYVAKDMSGAVYRGVIQAVDKNEVRRKLKQRDFFATSVKVIREWRKLNILKRVTRSEVAVFAEQLAVMVESGLTLVRCMETVLQQIRNQELVRIISEVKQDIENGVPFSESLRKHPRAFPPLFISMVMAGETGGTLAQALREIADYLDKEQQMRQKVKSALVYPKIVAFVSLLVIVAMITFIVPRFNSIYRALGITLPLVTRIMIGAGNFMSKFWWIIGLTAAGFYILYRRLRNVRVIKETMDKLKLSVPVFGDLNRKSSVSLFIRVLSTLIPSGVQIMKCLDVAEEVVDNVVMDRIIDGIRTSISSGGGLKEPIDAGGIFPPMVVQMVGVGEETGRLGDLLEKSSIYLDREIDATIKRLIARVEPTMTILVAGVVAIIAMSIYFPMFDMVAALK
ncbi:type II secretion system F family protein [Candidatus Poribacteria bacterium]